MASNIILTLESKAVLEDPMEVIPYILRHYAAAPKSASNTFFEENISLAETISRYGSNRIAIQDPIRTDLLLVLAKLYGGENVTVEVTTETENNVDYNIIIGVSVLKDGRRYTIDQSILVDDNGQFVIS